MSHLQKWMKFDHFVMRVYTEGEFRSWMKIVCAIFSMNFLHNLFSLFNTEYAPHYFSISLSISHWIIIHKKLIFLPIFILKNSSVRTSCSMIFVLLPLSLSLAFFYLKFWVILFHIIFLERFIITCTFIRLFKEDLRSFKLSYHLENNLILILL